MCSNTPINETHSESVFLTRLIIFLKFKYSNVFGFFLSVKRIFFPNSTCFFETSTPFTSRNLHASKEETK